MATNTATAIVGAQGRIVVPASVRKALNIEKGTVLTFAVEGDRAAVWTRESALAELQRMFTSALREPSTMSDDLIASRREDALTELTWMNG